MGHKGPSVPNRASSDSDSHVLHTTKFRAGTKLPPPASVATTRVLMSGIALKLTSLLVRTVAKPIATTLKGHAKNHEFFRNGCIRIAQTIHLTDVRLRMRLLGEQKIKVRPLNDTKAIEQGANFLSELFIFSVAGGLIFYESYRSRKKAADEKESLADDISTLQDEIEYIKKKLQQYNFKVDDYHPPAGVNPKIIKLPALAEAAPASTAATAATVAPAATATPAASSTAPAVHAAPAAPTAL